jgi:hypothetical protein
MIYDEAFEVRETRYGLFSSFRLNGDPILTGLTEEAVVYGTRFNLKAEQDGTLWTENITVIESASMGVKL